MPQGIRRFAALPPDLEQRDRCLTSSAVRRQQRLVGPTLRAVPARASRARILLTTGAVAVLAVLTSLVGLASPAAAVPTTPTAIDDAVGWWPFDEGSGSTSMDVGGSGNDATLHPPAGYTASAAPLDGTNPSAFHSTISPASYATPPGTTIDTLQQYSIALWVRVDPNAAGSFKTVISLPGKASITYNISHALTQDLGTLTFGAWTPGATPAGDRHAAAVVRLLTPGTWYHLALTNDGETIRGYLNGVPETGIGTGGPSHVGNGVSFGDPSFP